MGLLPTKGNEGAKWGGPPGPRGSPWTRSLAFDPISSRPTGASAADQGVRPTRRLQRSQCLSDSIGNSCVHTHGADMTVSQTKVLIVEDEAIVACDIERRLIKAGYAVPAIATSGEEAFRSIEQTSPNLVLMDIHLRGPADGIAIAAEVRNRFHLPVVFLTAYADKPTLERVKGSGAFSYLIKPIGHVNLASTIEVALYKHQVERELEKRDAWLQTVLDSMADAIVVTDAAGGIQFLNPTAERLTGWTNGEALGRPFWEVAHLAVADREIADDLQAAVRAGAPLDLPRESRLIARAAGRVAMVEGHIAISRIEGQPSGTVLTFRDVTARNWEEIQIRQDQKMQAAGQLANGLARDFKRLLRVILGYSQQLLLEMGPDNAYRERLQAIHRAGNRSALLASQVVGLYRKDPVQARIVDLNLLLIRFLPILKRMAGPAIAVEAALGPELGQIRADIGQLKQIVLNLALNARDGMPLGGRVCIETGNVELPDRVPYYAGPESFVRLAVEWHAITSEHDLSEPFFAGNDSGIGLGMAVVDAMVNAADGVISVDRAPGGGPRFEVFFPRWREALNTLDASPASRPGSSRVRTEAAETRTAQNGPSIMNNEPVELLLVEDNASDEELTLHVLQKNNLANRTQVVRDGAEALEFLFGDSGSIPRLILLDLKLPRVNGLELLTRIKQDSRTKTIPVVVLTSSREDADLRTCYELGVNSYIVKPVDFIQFTESVRQLGLYWLLFNEPARSYSRQRA